MIRIKEIRQRLGLSQKYVALSLGVKPPSVSDWESGKTCPTIDNLIALADLYGVTTDELLGREMQSEPAAIDMRLQAFYAGLNAEGQQKVLEYIRDLSENDRYKKGNTAERAI